jgi:hypothetical protein
MFLRRLDAPRFLSSSKNSSDEHETMKRLQQDGTEPDDVDVSLQVIHRLVAAQKHAPEGVGGP